MPVSIDDTFKEAYEKGEWRKAFVCTELLLVEETGLVICPPPQASHQYESMKYNLNVLLRYPNNDQMYLMVVDALKKYVEDWEFHM